MLKQVECSIVPRKGPLCGWMYMEVVLWMRRPTTADRDWFSTPKPTTGLPHGGGSAMPLFSTMGATQITSVMNLLKSYWPMAFVLGATSEYRILLVYGRIPVSIRPYTRSIRRTVCAESCMLCPCCMRLCARFHWATGPHMVGKCFCSNYSNHYVCECPSEGEGALFGEYSRIL